MKEPGYHDRIELPVDYHRILYRRHFQGALVRSAASVAMGLLALVAFLANVIDSHSFKGISLTIIYLILINPPTLWLLKVFSRRTRVYKYFSILINLLEIFGYTTIIYFMGGIESAYLTLIYAALITYIGIIAPRRLPFVIAALCSVMFSLLVIGEHLGVIPHQRIVSYYDTPWLIQQFRLAVVIGLLFIVAYISSYTASLLKKNRSRLLRQNFELMEKTAILEETEKKLQSDQQSLEMRVRERSAELAKANEDLQAELAERKRAEAERLNLVTAIEQSAEGIYLADTNWIIQYTNPAFEKMLGYDRGEMLGWHDRLLKSGKHDRIYYRNLRETLISGKVWSGRGINKKKDGTFIDADVTMSPVRDRSGNIINYVCIHRDITRETALETQLLQFQKLESIGTLAGGIAHDFNNLLMGIQGYASLMLLNIDPSHPNCERLKRIEEQVQSGADLTRQLLGFARGGRYEVKPADMNEILEKTSSMFGRTKKEISIHRKYGNNLFTVEVDQGQMEQVFMNLFVNAWQAMPGGGEIYLETENTILDNEQTFPHAVKPGKYVKITVTDTGTGMDEKTRERIFDPFFTTKTMGRGTGLGLATVYGIIKGHKGIINVDSEPADGTTFTIYLPISEKEVVQEKTATGTITRGTETILLVDDEKIVLEVSKELLESMGYLVYAAESGQEAIAVYMEKRNEIDLVILDMIMPEISGGETFDRIREINPEIRALLSSGYSIEGQAQQILDRGCNGFLQKPFHTEILSIKVRDILDGNNSFKR
ncbi:MAG: response regulator [Deltaproteobacteria bacterium]|nr:response regulator [Deltaproteobacteria bacterium]